MLRGIVTVIHVLVDIVHLVQKDILALPQKHVVVALLQEFVMNVVAQATNILVQVPDIVEGTVLLAEDIIKNVLVAVVIFGNQEIVSLVIHLVRWEVFFIQTVLVIHVL